MPGTTPPTKHKPRFQNLVVVFSIAVALGMWQLVSHMNRLPAYILPTPAQVWMRLWTALGDGSLAGNAAITLVEVLCGLALGVILAAALGYALARSVRLEQALSPYIVASQSVPIVAIAPLLVIWFGSGIFSKILICALIVFFPVLVNTIVGMRSVPEDLRDLMRSLQATWWQTFRMLEIHAALPVLLGGLRIGATLSVIGAVVGEFAGAKRGLGFLINVGRGLYDTPLVYVAVFTLILMAMALYGLVVWLERRFLVYD